MLEHSSNSPVEFYNLMGGGQKPVFVTAAIIQEKGLLPEYNQTTNTIRQSYQMVFHCCNKSQTTPASLILQAFFIYIVPVFHMHKNSSQLLKASKILTTMESRTHEWLKIYEN